ncbi:MAG: FtsQ-type POTRA domain-containing protein [Actinomycetaceae bacterium]|nr:FtsQ-type POTRA domain-containing protein [Actinomycetaceae bacterium]MDY5853930.1 FtsQ-type POTRA domain-containing protein [Arcanobacterium sp.]
MRAPRAPRSNRPSSSKQRGSSDRSGYESARGTGGARSAGAAGTARGANAARAGSSGRSGRGIAKSGEPAAAGHHAANIASAANNASAADAARADRTDRTDAGIGARSDGRSDGRRRELHADFFPDTSGAKVISMRERRAEKMRMNRLRWRYRLAVVAGLVVALGALVWLLFFSPLLVFSADRVQIQGAGNSGNSSNSSIVSVGDIQRALATHNGERLVLMRPSVVASDIEKIPEVAQAQVHFGFPASVRVDVVPEVPIACVADDAEQGSDCVAIAGSGVQLRVGSDAVKTLPKLTLETADLKLQNVAPRLESILHSVSPDIRKRITAISVGAGSQFSFTLDEQATVRWGTASQNEQKNTILSVLVKEDHKFYDVSVPTLPTTE